MIYDNNTYELEEMKQQMLLLKKKLEQQKIVNDKMLRSAMKKKLYGLNKKARIMFIIGIFVAIGAPGYFTLVGFTPLFCAATTLMLLFSAFKTFQYHKKLWRLNLSESNLIELAEELTLLRTRYKRWYRFAWCMIIPWVALMAYEATKIFGEELVWYIGGSAVGLIIGGLTGTRINNNMIRRTDELLEQIEEYRNQK
jgi:hypothetical protein